MDFAKAEMMTYLFCNQRDYTHLIQKKRKFSSGTKNIWPTCMNYKTFLAAQLIIIVATSACARASHIHAAQEWEASSARCSSEAFSGRIVGNTKHSREVIINVMLKKNIKSLWVGLQKETNGSPFYSSRVKLTGGKANSEDADKESRCTYLDFRDKVIHKSSCKDSTRASICEIADCHRCPSVDDGMTCKQKIPSCFIVVCKQLTWHEATLWCRMKGGMLLPAKGKTANLAPELSDEIKLRHERKCKKYWINATETRWITDTGGILHPDASQWLPGEPANCAGCDCVILTAQDREYGWKAVSCHGSHAFMCLKGRKGKMSQMKQGTQQASTTSHLSNGFWDNKKENLTTTENKDVDPSDRERNTLILILKILCAALALHLLAAVIKFIIKQKKNRIAKGEEEHPLQNT